jgi:hypothetical protein
MPGVYCADQAGVSPMLTTAWRRKLLDYLSERMEYARVHRTAVCEPLNFDEMQDIVYALRLYYESREEQPGD